MIQCTQCGRENAAESQFCRFCGNYLTVQDPRKQSELRYAPPRPYAWQTDEYQTQSEPRPTRPLDRPPTSDGRSPAFVHGGQQSPVFYQPHPMAVRNVGPDKSRVAYVLLGLFLGGLGIHNFYAGYTGKAVTQLLLNVFLWWTIIVPVGIWIWNLVEVITVERDARGNQLT